MPLPSTLTSFYRTKWGPTLLKTLENPVTSSLIHQERFYLSPTLSDRVAIESDLGQEKLGTIWLRSFHRSKKKKKKRNQRQQRLPVAVKPHTHTHTQTHMQMRQLDANLHNLRDLRSGFAALPPRPTPSLGFWLVLYRVFILPNFGPLYRSAFFFVFFSVCVFWMSAVVALSCRSMSLELLASSVKFIRVERTTR